MAEGKKDTVKQFHADQKRKRNDQPEIPFKRKCESTCDSSVSARTYSNMSGKENFEFFYGNKSPFSQHHAATFKIDGVTFNCAEQYMMYQKAVIFKDKEFEEKIMKTSDPVMQKKYGRKVRNFDKDVWKRWSTNVVERANEAKFSQNPDLKKQLIATFPRLLVEASPRDRLWGIGMGRNNPKAWDMKTWRGRNLLGHTLTRVRDGLMKKAEGDGGNAEEDDVNEKKDAGEDITNVEMVVPSGERGVDVKTDQEKDSGGDRKTDSAGLENVEKVDSERRENIVTTVNERMKMDGEVKENKDSEGDKS